jgi:hypothetical protein
VDASAEPATPAARPLTKVRREIIPVSISLYSIEKIVRHALGIEPRPRLPANA